MGTEQWFRISKSERRFQVKYKSLTRAKAYLEFFVSPTLLAALIPQIERDPMMTYYAINRVGDLRTNTRSEGPNAVTWGVFPGREILQPTIVEAVSFMAWKVRDSLSCNLSESTFGRTRRSNWVYNGQRSTVQEPQVRS